MFQRTSHNPNCSDTMPVLRSGLSVVDGCARISIIQIIEIIPKGCEPT